MPFRLSILCVILLGLSAAAVAETGGGVQPSDLAAERNTQYAEIEKELNRRDWYASVAETTARPEALILADDRDPLDVVLRRTAALLDDLRRRTDGLDDLAAKLATLRGEADAVGVDDKNARRALFDRACSLRREIALSNPLLDFDRLLFVKRQLPPPNHMCDQFFGCFASPGGGLFVLECPFGDDAVETDLLADATVEGGRLGGQRIEGGAFLSPTVSYDGETILFAYSECGLERSYPSPRAWFRDAEWADDFSYHVFSIGADGQGLRQLTDGPWNDMHPYFLPNGRVVFISERRGGFGRCHARPVPVYTLHTMSPDGGDMMRLSHHESNEWYPAVNNAGMIVYTRWDYVDRGHSQAHHPWITTPDGRDPRAIQGNFKPDLQAGPNMIMNVVPIPGSSKYLGVAAAHHQVTFGSLVLVDPNVPDDNKLSALRRVTPDNGFPETSENGSLKYGTPWALSEDYCLCSVQTNRYGLYLLDAFGNRVLLHADDRHHCTSPMPLRARAVPPIVPSQGEPVRLVDHPMYQRIGAEHPIDPTCEGMTAPATVSLINVYDSLLPFPEGVKVKELRVFHLLPKTVANHHDPQIGYGCETGARTVLGTVPVEEDGSANFFLPPGRSVYFQALDERGCAVQSMRSATYVHGGEQLVCSGCHEPKNRSPLRDLKEVPIAFRRPPSTISPEVPGSHPYSFPRLVQPVLEQHCVKCHEDEPDAMSLARGDWAQDPFRWYTSYRNLHSYAFHFGAPMQTSYDGWQPARTVPGQFGARASRLLKILDEGHHDVNLSPEELRRITLWLDANSDFLGSFENVDAQADGQLIFPTMN